MVVELVLNSAKQVCMGLPRCGFLSSNCLSNSDYLGLSGLNLAKGCGTDTSGGRGGLIGRGALVG